MNKTANYQLNQWAKSDRVLMDDFNADNAKIDAALKANASAIAAEKTAREQAVSSEVSARKSAVSSLEDKTALHTILTHYQRETVQQFSVNLSSVSWYQWRQVYLCVQLNGTGVCECGFNNMLRFCSFSLGERYCVIMTPLCDPYLKVSGLLTGPEIELVKDGYTYDQLSSLFLRAPSGSSITSGTITLKGIK